MHSCGVQARQRTPGCLRQSRPRRRLESLPKNSYAYKLQERNLITQDFSFPRRMLSKSRFVAQDTLQFAGDVARLDFKTITMKQRDFVRRNVAAVVRVLGHVLHELKGVGQGFRRFKDDLKFSYSKTKEVRDTRYKKLSYGNMSRIRQIRRDFIKIVPFTFFMVVPFLELLLPAWLIIFPNAIPSQFIKDEKREAMFKEQLERRDDAATKLMYILPNYLSRLERNDPAVPEKER